MVKKVVLVFLEGFKGEKRRLVRIRLNFFVWLEVVRRGSCFVFVLL